MERDKETLTREEGKEKVRSMNKKKERRKEVHRGNDEKRE